MLLTADWHLTDLPQDDYRWKVLEHISTIASTTGDKDLYILGDITDRKDRHGAGLVNRLVFAMRKLNEAGIRVTVLMGNHDKPLKGPPFWCIFNAMRGNDSLMRYVDKPLIQEDTGLALLPYADNPSEEWQSINFKKLRAAFIHQLVTGVTSATGRVLENRKMMAFPKHLKVWAGDIHDPQMVGQVQYVGGPHPIKFGDEYICRIVQLDRDFDMVEEYLLEPPRKLMLDIPDVEALDGIQTQPGEQARIRVHMQLGNLDTWAAQQEAIREWAQKRGVVVASLEAKFAQMAPEADAKALAHFTMDPQEAMALLGEVEEINDPLMEYGIALLEAELKGGGNAAY